MQTRWALLLIGFVMAAPAAAEDMSLEQARHFVIGKLFEASCFDGTRAIGRIYSDGSVIGTIQFRGTGPERSAWLPAGTLKVKGEAVCASLRGMPFEPCFKLNRTSDQSFRGSVLGFDIAYCDFTRRYNLPGGCYPGKPIGFGFPASTHWSDAAELSFLHQKFDRAQPSIRGHTMDPEFASCDRPSF